MSSLVFHPHGAGAAAVSGGWRLWEGVFGAQRTTTNKIRLVQFLRRFYATAVGQPEKIRHHHLAHFLQIIKLTSADDTGTVILLPKHSSARHQVTYRNQSIDLFSPLQVQVRRTKMPPKDPESGEVSKTETTPLVDKKETSGTDSTVTDHSVYDDALDTFKLGVPIFIAMLSWVGVSATRAGYTPYRFWCQSKETQNPHTLRE